MPPLLAGLGVVLVVFLRKGPLPASFFRGIGILAVPDQNFAVGKVDVLPAQVQALH